jgi:hypothetical protein
MMVCDEEVIPLRQRIETGVDDADLEEVPSVICFTWPVRGRAIIC